MEAGELFQLCRELKGLSMRDVEQKTGISNAYLSQLETGKIEGFSFSRAVILCDFYGLPIELLAKTVRSNDPKAWREIDPPTPPEAAQEE